MDESQRAMVAAKMANMTVGKKAKPDPDSTSNLYSANLPNKTSVAQAAETMNVSARSVTNAKKVLDEGGPGLQAAVVSGKMKVSTAAHQIGGSVKGPKRKRVKIKRDPLRGDALIIWLTICELYEFQEKRSAKELFGKMKINEKEDVKKKCPTVIKWLRKF
jgi:hypothetical protein